MFLFLERFMTNGHSADIPYRTTLNAELRNPEKASQIRAMVECQEFAGMDVTRIKNGGMDYCFVSRENTQTLKEKLNIEFKKLFPTLFTKTRYRGCALSEDTYEKISQAKIGDVIIPDEGFAYYAKNKEFAKDFAQGKNKTLIACKIPFWSRVSRMIIPIIDIQSKTFSFPKIGEVMVPAGSKYKLLSRSIDKDGVMNLCLKLLRK